MAIKYTSPIPTNPKEFVEPSYDSYFIHWLFRHLCVVCHRPASDVNEIVPRSRSKTSILDWKNRVLMCREDHNEYHKHGVNSKTQDELAEKRIEALKLFGREEYINFIPLEKIELPVSELVGVLD